MNFGWCCGSAAGALIITGLLYALTSWITFAVTKSHRARYVAGAVFTTVISLVLSAFGFSQGGRLPPTILFTWALYGGWAVVWAVADAQNVQRKERERAKAAAAAAAQPPPS